MTIYGCKGYQPGTLVGEDEISAWLKEKVPVIYSAQREQQRFAGCEIGLKFWTYGGFDDRALAPLKEARKNTCKYRFPGRTVRPSATMPRT